jgi:acetyltransferase
MDAVRPGGWPRRSTPVRLRDGATVRLRGATSADQGRLRAMFFTLSAATRYLYFCAGVPATEAWAERVAALGRSDGAGSYAMVVEADGAVVGVARFDRDTHRDSAEIGILLTDAWQSRGVGTEVVAQLRAEAHRRALSGFTATVLGENRRAMRLLRRAFPEMRATLAYGQYEVVMPFAAAAVERRD